MAEETGETRRAVRRYFIEFGASMLAYLLVLAAVVPFVSGRVGSPWRLWIGLLPLLPVAAMVWVLVRHYGRVDEMARRTIVEGMAFAFVLSAPIVITLGFLESTGLDLSIWWAWAAMGGSWALGSLLTWRRYR